MPNALTTNPDESVYSSSLLPGPAQTRLALAFVLGLLVIFFLITWPLKGVQPGPFAAFIPAYATAMFVNDWITAILLFAQFSVLRSRALLVIASGYLFTALILIPWIMTFPNVFGAGTQLGGLQSTSALYLFWHAGFAAFVIGYALSKPTDNNQRIWSGSVGRALSMCFTLTASTVTVIGAFCIAGHSLLPHVALDAITYSSLWVYYIGAPVFIICIVAITLLLIRRRSMLDLWLIVVMFLYAIEIPLTYYPDPVRFSVGFYAVRVIGLISSAVILIMLLYEVISIYRLIGIQAQRREREARLMTGGAVAATIAHEIKQPLSGMVMSADAGLRFLARPIPDFAEARGAFRQIAADGHRAGAVISGIQSIFKKGQQNKASFDLNRLITDTLELVRDDLKRSGIVTAVHLDQRSPQLVGNRIQIQQVLMNLITNAVDSMASISRSRALSLRSEFNDNGEVWVSIADNGPGIDAHDSDRVFNPLFTTKSDGMGMGLSICRSIIEAHDGRLWSTPNKPHGAVFYFSSLGSRAA